MADPTVTLFICGRQRERSPARCSTGQCSGAPFTKCQAPLYGKKQGLPCGAVLCASCVRPGPEGPLCKAHEKRRIEKEARRA
jgi:hypothetical protein